MFFTDFLLNKGTSFSTTQTSIKNSYTQQLLVFELLLPPYHPQICVLRYSFIKVSPDTIFVHPECNKPSPELSPIRLNCFSSGVDAKSVKHNTP